MKIFPAIDIKDKKCVRLVKGSFENKTEYEISPVEQAGKYKDNGFKNLHIVDLDGALTGEPINIDIIEDIVGKFDIKQANSELINVIGSTLTSCGLKKSDFTINVSNRKIIQGLMDQLKIFDEKQKKKVLRAIDKLDKKGFGLKGVEELLKKERRDASGAVTKGANLSDNQAKEIIDFLLHNNLEI